MRHKGNRPTERCNRDAETECDHAWIVGSRRRSSGEGQHQVAHHRVARNYESRAKEQRVPNERWPLTSERGVDSGGDKRNVAPNPADGTQRGPWAFIAIKASGPAFIDKSLVFVIDPALSQLSIPNPVTEHPLNFDYCVAAIKALDGNDHSKVLAGQHVLNRDKPTVRFLPNFFQDHQACRLAKMGACKRGAAKVVEYDLVVMAINDGSYIVRCPSIGVSLDDCVNFAVW